MASRVRNICTKNCQNLIIGFQATVENIGDFFRHSVQLLAIAASCTNSDIFFYEQKRYNSKFVN